MRRTLLAMALFCSAAAAGSGPSYTPSGVVNVSNYSPGPFAPNSVLALFGTGLSSAPRALMSGDVRDNILPTTLNYTQVFVENSPAPLFYVSDGQVNFVMPGNQLTGDVKVRVVKQGVTGPEIVLKLADAAPALFETADGYVIATHTSGVTIDSGSPAHPGEIVVLYATGLGKTAPNPAVGEIPQYPAQLLWLADLVVSVNGAAVDASRVKYAGVTPGCAGLYQINVELPDALPPDPEIRVSVKGYSSRSGLKLLVRQTQ
jgi:uncharacterized protein (TIGR03437 family)